MPISESTNNIISNAVTILSPFGETVDELLDFTCLQSYAFLFLFGEVGSTFPSGLL